MVDIFRHSSHSNVENARDFVIISIRPDRCWLWEDERERESFLPFYFILIGL